MALFPLFVDVENRMCLVFGGGKVALRKIRTLLGAGAEVHVWSKHICEDIRRLADTGELHIQSLDCSPESLLSQAFLVICATSDHGFNSRMVRLCHQLHIYVNCATEAKYGGEPYEGYYTEENMRDTSFIFPSLVVRDTVSVGISTHPPVPSLSKHLRSQLNRELPLWYGTLGRRLSDFRLRLRTLVPEVSGRTKVMDRLTEYGIRHEGNISEEVFMKFIDEENEKQ